MFSNESEPICIIFWRAESDDRCAPSSNTVWISYSSYSVSKRRRLKVETHRKSHFYSPCKNPEAGGEMFWYFSSGAYNRTFGVQLMSGLYCAVWLRVGPLKKSSANLKIFRNTSGGIITWETLSDLVKKSVASQATCLLAYSTPPHVAFK